ncbi:MAG: ABC transporter ATP-binding protein [Legionellaceae bacterium]|nr:ABC transporter ATP-binding protein [Legionellaceae bacterium]
MNKCELYVQNVTLDIPVFDSSRSLRKDIFNRCVGGRIQKTTGKHVCVRALDNISFALENGDRLALVGHNGAGKSTLLNTLGGIYLPHKGTIEMHGKVTSLFNLSLGLDVDDTGLENINTIGMYYGLSKEMIDEKRDEIIEFSELGDYIYLPARTYSSGMLLRLSFAIVTALEPEILLMDEGIGVGDASFAVKATERLQSFYHKAGIMVIASHSDDLIKRMCNKAILLEHGKIIKFGGVDDVLNIYHERIASVILS